MAQTTLTLDQTIAVALEHNYDIKIARNNIAIATTNATIGAAGFLPTVDIAGGYTFSSSNVQTTFSGNIPDQNITGAVSHNYNASANLRYTLFDGLRPVYTLKQAKLQVAIQGTRYQQAAETTTFQVIQAYYNLALLQADYRLAEEKLTLTKRQLDRVNTQRKYGQGSEVERLNLLTTYNNDSTQLLRLQLQQRQGVRQLNRAIGKAYVELDAVMDADLTLDLSLNYDALLDAVYKNNPNIQIAQQNVENANLNYKIVQTELYPKLNTTISYGYSGSNNDAGIVASNSSLGPSINLGLQYNLYAAGTVKRARQQSQLTLKNQELSLASARYDLEQQLLEAYTNHETNLALIPLEQSNAAISKTNFERTTTAYQLGQASLLQYQQAELQYIQAQQRVITAQFQAKLSEWQLRQLAGLMVEWLSFLLKKINYFSKNQLNCYFRTDSSPSSSCTGIKTVLFLS